MPARSLYPLLLALVPLACFDPPTLDEALPPLADLGPVDTWAELDEAGPPAGDDGPSGEGAPTTDDGESGQADEPLDPALAQLRLTEVLADPAGTDGGTDSPELVEIWNPGPMPVKLDGLHVSATSWPVIDATELGLEDVSLAVGGILVIRRWAPSSDPALAVVEAVDGVVWAGFLHSGGLRNADGSVILETATMSIDQVTYGPDAVPAPGSGKSLCMIEGTRPAEWAPCAPNPGALAGSTEGPDERTPIPPGALAIVEVWANPPGSSTEEKVYEFIEIVNLSENQLELSGCRVGDDPMFDAPGVDPLEYLAGDGGCESPTCLAPGARAIVVGQGYVGESGDALVLATDDTTIADGGLANTEPVVLWDQNGQQLSSYRLWPDPSGEPLPSDEQPLHRIEATAEDAPESWVSAPPSPGL
jgi:hypothetical protein